MEPEGARSAPVPGRSNVTENFTSRSPSILPSLAERYSAAESKPDSKRRFNRRGATNAEKTDAAVSLINPASVGPEI
jgi:hypothetical protein